jgi:hypothetical protein
MRRKGGGRNVENQPNMKPIKCSQARITSGNQESGLRWALCTAATNLYNKV